jgi:hypothetical protein
MCGLGSICCFLVPLLVLEAGPREPCPVVPVPKVYRTTGGTARLADAQALAIVVGARATEPERYAAERLQTLLRRRFKREVPVRTEGQLPADVRQVLLLGQRDTNAWIGKLCEQKKLDFGRAPPVDDGFLIEVVEDGGRQVVLIAGTNARGVIYGQEAFFDLLRAAGGQIEFPVVSVRDWPSIPWRGRPHSVLRQHLVPGAMDAYVRSRINLIDVRDDPGAAATIIFPARKASMGFPAGVPIDEPSVKRVIAEGHRRGMFVYGTVSCGVGQDKFDAVLATYRQLLALEVDGLWVSFDDVGAGQDAPALISRVLELGKQHGMAGRKIAVTPPAGSYEFIDKEFNRVGAKIPGFGDALWFFTRTPCQGDVEMARRIGITRLPAWWHNLVEIEGGFLHNGGVVCPLRADGKPGYLDMQPLAKGWHYPRYEQIQDAEKHTDTVILWGVCGGWPEEYEVGALGLWAWEPAKHDWGATRASVYRFVYGPSQVDAARTFDDRLAELKSLFHLPLWGFQPNKGWPCRLKNPQDRPKALALLDELVTLHASLQTRAPAETAIDPARLAAVYLEPMGATLTYARKMTLLDYPEDWLGDFEAQMLALIDGGDRRAAEQALAKTREKVESQVARIGRELQGLKGIDEYAAFWRQRVSDVAYWETLATQRRAKAQQQFKRLMTGDPAALFPYRAGSRRDLDALFVDLASPPAGQPVGEIRAEDWLRTPPRCRGAFSTGSYEWQGRRLAAIVYPRHVRSVNGDYAEFRAELAVPKQPGRLVLDAFVNDTRDDNHWTAYRFMQLWVGDRLAWEEDIALDRKGRPWVTVDVSADAQQSDRLAIRFRVVDKRGVGDHLSVAFLGPVRLRVVAAK